MKGFMKSSGFGRWMSSLSSFALGSSNKKASQIFAKYVEACRQHPTHKPTYQQPNQQQLLGHSSNGVHESFSYDDWERFLYENCSLDLNDKIITRNSRAIT